MCCLIVLCSLLRSEAGLLKDAGDDHARVHRVHTDPLRRNLVVVRVSVMILFICSLSPRILFVDFTSFNPQVPQEQSSV